MLLNYWKIALRNLLRAKGFAFINIAGLAVGMAASALIYLWIQSEQTYDRFYTKTDRLFQVYNRDTFSGETKAWETTPRPLAPYLTAHYPDIEASARFRPTSFLLTADGRHLNASGAFADPAFLNLFDFPLMAGTVQSALREPTGIVLTESMAIRLFGRTEVTGQSVQLNHEDSFLVTGVLKDLPDNSRFSEVDYLLPYAYFIAKGWGSDEWSSNNDYSFVLLKPKASADAVNAKIKSVTARQLKGVLDDVSHREIFLHPASKWHLYARQENGQLVDGQIVTVRLFAVIAALILLVAAVNFVNLSTAGSEKRAKEIGVRKVAGARKSSLIFQFLCESVILAMLAGILALGFLMLSVPLFNDITGKQVSFAFDSAGFWLAAIAFVLFTGLLAGSYPALYLAGFQPIRIMKGSFRPAQAAFSPRKGLVVMQFTFAIILIIGTLVIKQQITYARERESGYNQHNLLFSYLNGALSSHSTALRQELLKSGAAVSVSQSMGPMTDINTRQWGLSWRGSTKADKDIEFDRFGTDAHFLQTTGTKLVAGREIDIYRYPADSNAVMLNETAVKAMRLEQPLGTTVRFLSQDWHVVGVVKDFIFSSPYEAINPVIVSGPNKSVELTWVSIRLNPTHSVARNLETAEAIFKKYEPGYPFEYAFADESYKAKFASEQRIGVLTGLFSGLTIFITCLGLFGLAAYTARQRTKEIGIRKVLGASVSSIIQLLSGGFLKLMLVAFLIGAPIGWYVLNQWLADYAYRITIGPGIFLLTLLAATVIVVITVSSQAIRAALVNPVKSLRSE
ncbi:ABC transporter permease [Arsenicibacter rosenii]|uniref:ABC transporter permease n=2 Tax=Arsenicibacter rosenii TaxID=1750698 RepID=A0A1S2VFZ3_9BACT|nr:ABC transporter permease [Arsenicibacter rosenii]